MINRKSKIRKIISAVVAASSLVKASSFASCGMDNYETKLKSGREITQDEIRLLPRNLQAWAEAQIKEGKLTYFEFTCRGENVTGVGALTQSLRCLSKRNQISTDLHLSEDEVKDSALSTPSSPGESLTLEEAKEILKSSGKRKLYLRVYFDSREEYEVGNENDIGFQNEIRHEDESKRIGDLEVLYICPIGEKQAMLVLEGATVRRCISDDSSLSASIDFDTREYNLRNHYAFVKLNNEGYINSISFMKIFRGNSYISTGGGGGIEPGTNWRPEVNLANHLGELFVTRAKDWKNCRVPEHVVQRIHELERQEYDTLGENLKWMALNGRAFGRGRDTMAVAVQSPKYSFVSTHGWRSVCGIGGRGQVLKLNGIQPRNIKGALDELNKYDNLSDLNCSLEYGVPDNKPTAAEYRKAERSPNPRLAMLKLNLWTEKSAYQERRIMRVAKQSENIYVLELEKSAGEEPNFVTVELGKNEFGDDAIVNLQYLIHPIVFNIDHR